MTTPDAGRHDQTDLHETVAASTRRLAGELWRLASGLSDRGIPLPEGEPVDSAPVTAALAALDRQTEALAERPTPTTVCEADANAARQLAGQLARLDARLFELGIKRDPDDRTPPDEWPVTAALAALAEARHDAARYKADYLNSCQTIAQMHAAATGRTGEGPRRGVIEDVADVRARAEAAEGALSAAPDRAGLVLLRIVEAADRALTNWSESSGAVRGELRRRLAEAVDAGWDVLRPTGRPDGPRQPAADTGDDDPALLPELVAYAAGPEGQPSPGLLADMRRIATQYRGVAYDPHDRPTEILAVRRAAYTVGIVPFPDESVPPRSYRGGVPPTPPIPPAALASIATVAMRPDAVSPIVERWLNAGEHVTIADLGEHPSPTPPGIADAVSRRAYAALADVYRDGYRDGYRDADNGNDPSDGPR